MAKDKEKAKENDKLSWWGRMKENAQKVKTFFANQTVQFVIGLICIAFAIFLASSFLSFFSAGGDDQSVVEGVAAAAGDAAGNTSGKGGAAVAQYFINKCFGWASVLVLPLLVVVSLYLMGQRKLRVGRWCVMTVFLLVWCSILFDFAFGNVMADSFMSPGGRNGELMKDFLYDVLGIVGLVLLLLLSMSLFIIWLAPKVVGRLQELFGFIPKDEEEEQEKAEDAEDEAAVVPVEEVAPAEETVVEPETIEVEIDDDAEEENAEENGAEEAEEGDGDEVAVVIEDLPMPEEDEEDGDEAEDADLELAKRFDELAGGLTTDENADEIGEVTENAVEEDLDMEVEEAEGDDDMGGKMLRPINPKDELSYYKPPTLDLLDEYEQGVHSIDKDEQAENANNIVKALRNFGIEISSIKATVGPTITLYEITPAPGVRISKIRNLEDDIAMSLSALCIRIVAPIPGKGTIGIEVPNTHKQIVPMVSLLNSRKYKETDMALPLALGKTISNEVYMVDMAKMPHLLVAGATGMGKSVGLNAIITSLLYKMHPAYLKFVMVDPKMVELSLYSVLEKHFLAKLEGEDEPIITDVNKVVRTLKSLCVEMDNRYKLLQMASVRSVKEYNEKYLNKELLPTKGHRFMPYIVVIIDEYGDLMMTAGREVEQPIARIAQKARAVGIHMIIATQRPTTNIITGTIKANFPARMAFRVISTIDSRTILDRSGANQLQGRGDMLFLAGNDPVRVQCALVETKEVERVCAHIAKQQGYQSAYILPEPDETADFGDGGNGGGAARGDISPDKLDPLFAEAARVVVLAQHGSTSLIQRKLEIGFNRAGRIMDQLCRMGIVGEQEGSKPRQVLCADEADLEFRLKSML